MKLSERIRKEFTFFGDDELSDRYADEVAQLELKIKLLLKLIEYAARVLDNARMYDTAEYLLKEAGIDDETTK